MSAEVIEMPQSMWPTFYATLRRLIDEGAYARIGPRKVHLILRTDSSKIKLACERADWDRYLAAGNPAPEKIIDGLR